MSVREEEWSKHLLMGKVEFNVMKHKLVPEHYLLSKKEEEEILKKYGVEKDSLPKIRLNDPCIIGLQKFYGQVEEWSIVKIIRESPTAGISVAYRVVVKA